MFRITSAFKGVLEQACFLPSVAVEVLQLSRSLPPHDRGLETAWQTGTPTASDSATRRNRGGRGPGTVDFGADSRREGTFG